MDIFKLNATKSALGGHPNNFFTVGGFEAVEDINEASSLPEEVLQDYPEILTWDKLLNEDLDFPIAVDRRPILR